MTRFATLELGGLVRRDLKVITRDYGSRLSPEAGFAGIIGRDFFGDGLLVIDYPRAHADIRQRPRPDPRCRRRAGL